MAILQVADPGSEPPPPDTTDEHHEIGVPRGYVAQIQTPPHSKWGLGPPMPAENVGVPARYFEGDDWQPAGWPPDQIADLQRALIAAGLIDPKATISLGYYDITTRTAYRELLTTANASGMDRSQALQMALTAPRQGPGIKETPRQPLVMKLSNPDDLRAVFRKAIIDELGQGWSSDQIDQMVTDYQARETEVQQQQYAMTGFGSATEPGPGGTLTPPPSPDVYAAAKAREQDPELAQEHDALGFVGQFNDLVGKWGGVR